MYAHLLGAAPEALISELNAIAEATVAAPGDPEKWRLRYSPAGVDGLRRLVVGWNVNRRLLDLAFLVAAIEYHHTAGALDFFFSGRSFTSKDRFRQALTSVCGTSSGDSPYAIDGRGLVSHYGGEERVLWWNQDVLVLPPLFELLCTINPDPMMRDCHALGKDGIGADDVKVVASGWQSRMYHWLRELTGASAEDADPLASLTQQRVRHFSYMVKWLRADASVGGARDAVSPLSDLLDDERVLAFWRDHWPNRSLGETPTATLEGHAQTDSESVAGSERYRSFALVAELAMHLWSATDAGLAKMSPHLSLMIRAGEGDGTIAEDALDLSEIDPGTDSASLLRALGSPPLATIKFLKDSEKRAVEPVVSAGAAAHRLPLTLLRVEVFGTHQRRLGRASGGHARLAGLLDCSGLPTYECRVEDFLKLATRLSKLRDCCLHVLVHLRDPYAVGRIRNALPNLACWNDIEASIGDAATPRAASNAGRVLDAFAEAFFRSLSSTRLRVRPLNDYLSGLATAFRDVNTQGFRELPETGTQLDGIDVPDVYALGDGCLEGLAVVLEGFLRTLDGGYGPVGLRDKFASDVALFQEGFTRIYAGGGPA